MIATLSEWQVALSPETSWPTHAEWLQGGNAIVQSKYSRATDSKGAFNVR